MFYNLEPINQTGKWYFSFKIRKTDMRMISAGVFTEGKDKSCGYCQSDKMYYVYSKNGRIYHGSNLWIFDSSK